MEQINQTGGSIVINLTANGFIVMLPPKVENPYLKPFVAAHRAVKEEDDEIAQLKSDSEPRKPDEPGYEMATLRNVYIFHDWANVLDFLAEKLSPVPVETVR